MNLNDARRQFEELKTQYDSLDVSIRMVESDGIRAMSMIQRFTGSNSLSGAIKIMQESLMVMRAWTITFSALEALAEAATFNPLALFHAGIAITSAATMTYTLAYDATRGMPQV